MASIRIGFSSDFVLKNGVVGLGTTVGSTTDGKLELDNGALRANLSVSGVATLTAYGGFIAQKQHVNKPAAIGFGTVGLQTAGVGTAYQYYETETGFTDLGGVHHGDDQYFNTLSEDLVIDDGQILNITNTNMVGVTTIGEYDPHTHASYVCAGSLEQVSVTGHFSVPNGGINDRQLTPIEGTVRFNDDLNTLEFFNGNEWRQFTYNQGQSGRGVFAGGNDVPNRVNIIDYVSIQTFGNSIDFGDLITQRQGVSGGSDGTRGLALGGYVGSGSNEIDYITIASAGNGIDFGNLTNARWYTASASSSTRCVTSGGSNALTAIDYVEIATTGNSLSFGTLAQNFNEGAGCQSPTRGFFLKHATTPTTIRSVYITIASKGNGTPWDELTTSANQGHAALSNSVQAFVAGGDRNDGIQVKHIDTFNMASLGAAYQFGELTSAGSDEGRGYSSPVNNSTRGLFAGGNTPAAENRIDYITLTTAGNAQDFGDLSHARGGFGGSGISDSHGGLGGF